MRKNYSFNFKADVQFEKLINETLEKLNKEIKLPLEKKIDKSDFLRCAVARICMELRTGTISSSSFIYNNK